MPQAFIRMHAGPGSIQDDKEENGGAEDFVGFETGAVRPAGMRTPLDKPRMKLPRNSWIVTARAGNRWISLSGRLQFGEGVSGFVMSGILVGAGLSRPVDFEPNGATIFTAPGSAGWRSGR